MYSFGKRPPRNLESFGVAGLLGEECHIFYQNIFSTRHVGQFSDLLAARLQKVSPDELKLRALLLFSVFEAYRFQAKLIVDAPLVEPITVECGIDAEKIAVGIAFTPLENVSIKLSDIEARVMENRPEGGFEELLTHLFMQAHRVVLRHDPRTKKIEVVALLGTQGRMDASELGAPHSFTLVNIRPNSPTPKATAYVELGDLDYAGLLRQSLDAAKLPAPNSGEILGKVTSIEESTALADALRAKRQGGSDRTVISGVTQNTKDELLHIKGGSSETQDQSVTRINAADPNSPQAKMYLDQITQLHARIAELEAERDAAEVTISGSTDADAGGSAGKMGGLFKKVKGVWPFKKEEDEEEDDEEEEEVKHQVKDEAQLVIEKPVQAAPSVEAEPAPLAPDNDGAPVTKTETPESSLAAAAPSNTELAGKSLEAEIQAGSLDRTIAKAQKEASEIKKELSSAKAKKWVDGLMSDLVSEKARLQEFAKKLNSSIRQKELEFKNREQSLNEEIRRRDEMLKQKNTAIARGKDQLAQTNLTIERLRAAGSGKDQAGFKQKYEHTQKLFEAVEREKQNLTAEIDKLKNLLSVSQMQALKGRGISAADYQALQSKYERAQRQADEFKRSNQALMDKVSLAEGKPGAPARGGAGNVAANLEETRKRLDAAMKMANAGKKEAEQLTLKLEEVQREESRLKRELEMALAELKKLKKPPAAA